MVTMDRANIVFIIAMASVTCAFALLISSSVASQKDYVKPNYEGEGTSKIFRVDYGVTFTGVTTAIASFFQFYAAFKLWRGSSDLDALEKLIGATIVLVLLDLQSAFCYGNELLIVQEIDSRTAIDQVCGGNHDGAGGRQHGHEGCRNVCDDNSDPFWMRYYEASNLDGPLGAATAFSVLLFLTDVALAILLNSWGMDIASSSLGRSDSTYQGL